MTFGLYCQWDKVSEDAGPLFQSRNDATAIRSARGALHEGRQDPGDFVLYFLGQFDNEKIKIFSEGPKEIKIYNSKEEEKDEQTV